MRRSTTSLLLGSWLVLTGCEPLVMIPGGQLSGTLRPAPTDWSFTDAEDTVVLETRPDDPYSVNVWGVAADGRFFIAAGDAESTWAKNVQANPLVRLKIADAIYELRATATEDPKDLDAFLVAVKEKYDFEPEPEQRSTSTLFVLGPR